MDRTLLKLALANGKLDSLYADRVSALIREKYSVNDELAISRQRYVKTQEFDDYYNFCERCKAKARKEIYDN